MAKRIEDLPVYQHAVRFCDANDAILLRPALRRNRKLWDQIAEANDSILSNMREGFELSTDDAFANMLTYAKGSCAEVLTRLFRAHRRRCLTLGEFEAQRRNGEELQRMLGGFIKYLRTSGFKDRGSFRARHPEAPPPDPEREDSAHNSPVRKNPLRQDPAPKDPERKTPEHTKPVRQDQSPQARGSGDWGCGDSGFEDPG